MAGPARPIGPGIIVIVLGIVLVIGAAPLALLTMFLGAVLCDAPGSSEALCGAVAFAPPVLLAGAGLAVCVFGVVLVVRARRG